MTTIRKPMLWGIVICLFIVSGCKRDSNGESGTKEAVILAATAYQMGFLAAGTNGTMASVQMDGSIETIDSDVKQDIFGVTYNNGKIWAVGASGTILYAGDDLNFTIEDSGTKKDLRYIKTFQGTPYAAGDAGLLLVRDEEKGWSQVEVLLKGDVVGMEASLNTCLVATDAGEVAYTTDGRSWSLLPYNEYYGKDIEFKGSCYGNSMFWIYGRGEKGRTELIFSTTGEVWGTRDINYLEGMEKDLSGYEICSMASDGRQLYAWCDNGILLTLSDCTQCNKETVVEGVQGGIVAYYGGSLLVMKSLEQRTLLSTDDTNQYSISAESAYEKQKEGAVIIDVRSLEEYEEKHIKDSISMEAGAIREKLTREFPDFGQEIIFYCQKGIRSKDALEQALDLGYVNVYDLGSIEKWNYNFEGEGLQ